MNQEICSRCRRPKGTAKAGSLTQWITLCACDSLGSSDEFVTTRPHCLNCGKVIAENRAGSLTQWVFAQAPCNCEVPVPNTPQPNPPVPTFQSNEEAIANEVELPVEESKFPLQRYKPLQVLGSGISGDVYLSRDRLLKKHVAVKVLKILDKNALIAFQNEAKTTSRLNHPNIVKILDFGVTSGATPYMVMDYISGISMEEFLKEGPLDVETAVSIFAKLADALQFAHGAGVLHRDLKPSNILVMEIEDTLDVFLIDFGVAKLQEDLKATTADGKTLIGTPSYMSPDQAHGLKYDNRSDLYSFGCIMYEALTGEQPFQSESSLEVIYRHAHEEPPSLLAKFESSNTILALDEIIQKCMKKSPDERFKNAESLKNALNAVPFERETEEPAFHQAENQERLKEHKSAQSKGYALTIAASMTIIAAGALIYFIPKLHDSPDKSSSASKEIAAALKVKSEDQVYSLDGVRTRSTFIYSTRRSVPKLVAELSATDESLEDALRIHPDVRAIEFAHSDITAKSLRLLADKTIESIDYPEKDLLAEDFEGFARIKSLKSLTLVPNMKVDIKSMRLLSQLPNLAQLKLSYANITAEMLETINSIKSLRYLSMRQCSGFPNVDLSSLSTKIDNLDFANSDITDENIKQLARLVKLNSLDLSGTNITDRSFDRLAKLKSLKTIDLTNCPMTTAAARERFLRKSHLAPRRSGRREMVESFREDSEN